MRKMRRGAHHVIFSGAGTGSGRSPGEHAFFLRKHRVFSCVFFMRFHAFSIGKTHVSHRGKTRDFRMRFTLCKDVHVAPKCAWVFTVAHLGATCAPRFKMRVFAQGEAAPDRCEARLFRAPATTKALELKNSSIQAPYARAPKKINEGYPSRQKAAVLEAATSLTACRQRGQFLRLRRVITFATRFDIAEKTRFWVIAKTAPRN